MSESINIQGLDKVELLHQLVQGASYQGFNLAHGMSGGFDREAAKKAVKQPIDYFCGKPITCNLSGDSFDPWLYDRDAGKGAAARIVKKKQKTKHIMLK